MYRLGSTSTESRYYFEYGVVNGRGTGWRKPVGKKDVWKRGVSGKQNKAIIPPNGSGRIAVFGDSQLRPVIDKYFEHLLGYTSDDENMNAYWIQQLSLTNQEKAIISCGLPLTTPILNAAMRILKEENDKFSGFQDITQTSNFAGDGRPFIQIVPLASVSERDDSHWGTLSNVKSSPNNVNLYDSAPRRHFKTSKGSEVRYHRDLDGYAASLRNLHEEQLSLCVADVKTILRNANSGVAAIFYALTLSRGLNPMSINYNYKSLRQQLIDCLAQQSFKSVQFSDSPRQNKGILYEFSVDLYCHCLMPDLGGVFVICDSCSKHFHVKCVNVDLNSTQWKCTSCLDGNQIEGDGCKQVDGARGSSESSGKGLDNARRAESSNKGKGLSSAGGSSDSSGKGLGNARRAESTKTGSKRSVEELYSEFFKILKIPSKRKKWRKDKWNAKLAEIRNHQECFDIEEVELDDFLNSLFSSGELLSSILRLEGVTLAEVKVYTILEEADEDDRLRKLFVLVMRNTN